MRVALSITSAFIISNVSVFFFYKEPFPVLIWPLVSVHFSIYNQEIVCLVSLQKGDIEYIYNMKIEVCFTGLKLSNLLSV